MKKLKLNNKGLTVVELVVTFVILMILVIGMLEVIVELKDTASEKILEKELIEYQGTITQLIQDDLIKNQASSVSVCSNNNDKRKPCYNITFKNGTKKQLIINMVKDDTNKKYISYDGINYPLPQQSLIEFRDSAVLYNPTNLEKEKNDIKVNVDDNNFLFIYIPFYIVDENYNYGIDIVYPIGL